MTNKSPDELSGETEPTPSGGAEFSKTLPIPVTGEQPWSNDDATSSQIVSDALGDRYDIESVLGKGSFGSVYKVRDTVLNRTVAVKNILLDTTDPELQDDIKKRFLREARVAALLRHPNIVTIHDIISTPHASLILMEFVEGVSLQAMLETKKRLDLAETIDILKQVAFALDHAHEHKVIHRDVKPANIMVTSSKEVRVTDFGIAKTDASSDITISGTILGTPDYMSPEQAKGEPIDGRSDLFSLGCILHECLVGEKPFKSESITGVLMRIISENPPPSVNWEEIGLPGGLEPVMNKALAKVADDRYPTGTALVEALEGLVPEEDEEILVEIKLTQEVESAEGDEVVPPIQDNQGCSPASVSYLDALKEVERPLTMTTDNPNVVHDLNLDSDEAYIISRIDGHATARDILTVSPLPENETARSLLALIEMGLVKFHGVIGTAPVEDMRDKQDEQRDESPEDQCDEFLKQEVERFYELSRHQDQAQFLGLDIDTDHDKLKEALQEKLAIFNPSAHPRVTDAEFRQKLHHLFSRANEAYAAISKELEDRQTPSPAPETAPTPAAEPQSQLAYEETVAPPQLNGDQAEDLYLRAEKAYAARDFWETIQLCRYAAAASPRDSRFRYFLGLALSENAYWRKEAEESLKAALEIDSKNPEYIYALADFYQKLGRTKEAKEMYDRAKSFNKPEADSD
jgi:serine/threonine protein kinase